MAVPGHGPGIVPAINVSPLSLARPYGRRERVTTNRLRPAGVDGRDIPGPDGARRSNV